MNKIELIKEILQKEGNTHTDVVEIESTKGAYYSYFTDSVYISSKTSKCEEKDIVVVCHECIHSMQDKRLHIVNLIFSNLELLLFITTAICIVFGCFSFWAAVVYVLCGTLSIVARCLLELPAMTGAFELAKKYSDEKNVKEIEKEQKNINKMLPLGILSFTWSRLFRIALILVLFCLI